MKIMLIYILYWKLPIIDKKLILGASMFGIGWGMVGFCPGPAISSIALLNAFSLLFIGSMITGFYLSQIIKQ